MFTPSMEFSNRMFICVFRSICTWRLSLAHGKHTHVIASVVVVVDDVTHFLSINDLRDYMIYENINSDFDPTKQNVTQAPRAPHQRRHNLANIISFTFAVFGTTWRPIRISGLVVDAIFLSCVYAQRSVRRQGSKQRGTQTIGWFSWYFSWYFYIGRCCRQASRIRRSGCGIDDNGNRMRHISWARERGSVCDSVSICMLCLLCLYVCSY